MKPPKKKRLPRTSSFAVIPPPNSIPYFAWVVGMGYSRQSGVRWVNRGLVVTFKAEGKPKGVVWIANAERERFTKILKGEAAATLPPSSNPLNFSPVTTLEKVDYASISLFSPSLLASITGSSQSFELPSSDDWEKDYSAAWGIISPTKNLHEKTRNTSNPTP
jgi:hypothetical protein